MADNSKIEWTEATWNPITGCSVVSPGCTNCYAMRLAGTRMKHHESRAGLTIDTKAGPVWNGEVRFNEKWLDQPLRWKRERMIFVCAHGDLFHESVPDEWIDRVFAIMALAPQHTFQVLTKRAERMRDYFGRSFEDQALRDAFIEGAAQSIYAARSGEDPSAWLAIHMPLPNVWLGVSAEDQRRADERIPDLLRTPAAVRFVSLEPLLGSIDLNPIVRAERMKESVFDMPKINIDWVIVGGESGPNARPMHPQWARDLRDQCQAASVPFFFKQHGEWREPLEHEDYDTSKGRLGKPPAFIISNDGTVHCFSHLGDDKRPVVIRVGKKAAGRLLDGRTWDEMPARLL